MEANSIPSVFAINKYLWKQIKDNAILDEANYGGLIPIIPIQESAPFIQAMEQQAGIGQFPFVIYSWYTNGIDADSWFKQTDTVIYTIYSTDQKKLRQLVLLFVSLLKRFDLSAQSVNRFMESQNPPLSAEYLAFDYKSIHVAASNAGTPAGAENDPNVATVTIRVTYTNDENDLPLP